MSVVWATIFKLDLSSFMPFVLTGNAAWSFLSGSLGEAPSHIASSRGLLVNMRGGADVATLITIIRNVINSATSIVVALLVTSMFKAPTPWLLLVPIIYLLMILTLYPYVYLIGVFGVYVRDLEQFFPTVLLVIYMTTPILFSIEQLGSLARFVRFSPFYVLVSSLREPMLGGRPSTLSICLVFLYLVIGWAVLGRVRPKLANFKLLL
jgi:ABC-type polysaccharide/polyol phosphate export permease